MTVCNNHSIEEDFNIKKIFSTAIKNSFVADSLAMPVHWFYRVTDILEAFPDGIKRFYPAPKRHPSSIMSLHSMKQGGRAHLSDQQKDVVGEIILKDKAKFWNQTHVHYHQGMQAGDNTLNAYTVLWLMQSMLIDNNQLNYDESHFLDIYIKRMTADNPQHPDTYAESYHRGFFANWAQGTVPTNCAAVTHDTPSIGGLVRVGPLVLISIMNGLDLVSCKSLAARHLKLTHPDSYLTQVCFQYIDLVFALIAATNQTTKESVVYEYFKKVAGKKLKHKNLDDCIDNQVIGGMYSSACYITDAWPSILYLACKYSDSTSEALQKNAELGGDNVHRGSVLAIIMTLLNGQKLTELFNQLVLKEEIEELCTHFMSIGINSA